MVDFIVFRTLFIIILSVSAGYFRPSDEPFWTAALIGAALGVLAIILERRVARVSLQRLIGVVFGVVAGLVCAALVSLVMSHAGADNSNALRFVQVVCMLFFAYRGSGHRAPPRANC